MTLHTFVDVHVLANSNQQKTCEGMFPTSRIFAKGWVSLPSFSEETKQIRDKGGRGGKQSWEVVEKVWSNRRQKKTNNKKAVILWQSILKLCHAHTQNNALAFSSWGAPSLLILLPYCVLEGVYRASPNTRNWQKLTLHREGEEVTTGKEESKTKQKKIKTQDERECEMELLREGCCVWVGWKIGVKAGGRRNGSLVDWSLTQTVICSQNTGERVRASVKQHDSKAWLQTDRKTFTYKVWGKKWVSGEKYQSEWKAPVSTLLHFGTEPLQTSWDGGGKGVGDKCTHTTPTLTTNHTKTVWLSIPNNSRSMQHTRNSFTTI